MWLSDAHMIQRRTAPLRLCAAHVSSRGTPAGFTPLADTALTWQAGQDRQPGRPRAARGNVSACVRPPILYHDAPSYELQHLFAYAMCNSNGVVAYSCPQLGIQSTFSYTLSDAISLPKAQSPRTEPSPKACLTPPR